MIWAQWIVLVIMVLACAGNVTRMWACDKKAERATSAIGLLLNVGVLVCAYFAGTFSLIF